MAANLDRKEDGGAAFVYNPKNGTAWHGEGEPLTEAERASVPRVIERSGLGFPVEVRPIYAARTIGSGKEAETVYEPIKGWGGTYRTDRNALLGVVGSRYTPLQNADAFGVLQPLLDAGVARVETAGSLRGGADVWMLVEFQVDHPTVQEVFNGEVIPYGLISNNHSGRRQVTVMETPIRVVCANTLGMSHAMADNGTAEAIKIRHTISVERKTVEAAEELFKGVVERHVEIARQYKAMKETYLEEERFRALILDVAAPIPMQQTFPMSAREESAHLRQMARRDELSRLWTAGLGHKGDRSLWEAYNGFVQAVDHNTTLWRTRGSRVVSMMDGGLGNLKQRVLDVCVAYAFHGMEAVNDNAALSA